MAWGGYWYLRNWLVTGSPFYPKEFFTSNDLLLKLNPDTAFTSFFGNRRPELLPLFLQAIWHAAGPCQLAGFVGIMISVPWLLMSAVLGSRQLVTWQPRTFLALLILGSGLLLGITPFAVENNPGTLNQLRWHYCPVRYGTCFLSMAVLGLLIVLSDIFLKIHGSIRCKLYSSVGWRWGVLLLPGSFGLLVGGGIVWQIVLENRRVRGTALDCWLVGLNAVLALIVLRELSLKRTRLLAFSALLLVSSWCIHGLSARWHESFRFLQQASLNINPQPLLPSAGVKTPTLCVLDSRYYWYFGSRRQYRVCQPIYAYSSEWFLDYIRREQVDLVVLKRRPTGGLKLRYSGVNEYIAQNPHLFQLVFEDDEFISAQGAFCKHSGKRRRRAGKSGSRPEPASHQGVSNGC